MPHLSCPVARILVAFCSVIVVSLGTIAGIPQRADCLTARELLRRLSSAEEGVRFDAARTILESSDASVGVSFLRALAMEEAKQILGNSPEALAAADFLRLKLSGNRVAPGPPPQRERPSVLMISIDTLRADHLGCYGYERNTSPTIDALAESGAVFLDALSVSSWTLPAHMSMLTSLYPSFHKLEKGGKLGSTRLDESETTLAELLREAGYATVGIVAHPFLSAAWGFDRGFDLYRRYGGRAEAQTFRAVLWLEWHEFHVQRRLHDASFFFFLHYIDPHETYDAPGAYATKHSSNYRGPLKPTDKMVTLFSENPFATPEDLQYAIALYDGEISYVDAQLRPVLRELERLGRRRSTIVLLTSDHGEEFKDHGSMGHKRSLYDEQLRVPLILSWPGHVAPGRRLHGAVSLVDILPTITELVGLPPLPAGQGTSLAKAVTGDPPPRATLPQRHIFAELGPMGAPWELDKRLRSVVAGETKLIVNYGKDRSWKEVYRITEDPGETDELSESDSMPAKVRELETRLDAFVRAGLSYRSDIAEKNEIEIDAKTQERLRALGYMDGN